MAPPPTGHAPASPGSRGVAFPPHEVTWEEWEGINLDGYKINEELFALISCSSSVFS